MQRICNVAIAAIFLLIVPGCFDYQVKLDLKADGSGQVAFTLKTPAAYQIDWETPLVQRIFSPPAERMEPQLLEQYQQLEERADFNYLGDLHLSRIYWSIAIIDRGVLGLTDYTYRITTVLMGEEGIAPEYSVKPSGFERQPKEILPWQSNASQDQALALRALAAGSHSIIISQKLPGQVVEAQSIKLGQFVVDPVISGDTVTWEIPLAQLIANDVRGNLRFSADFKADYEPHVRFRPAWSSLLHQGE